jgi:hypothetical protein
MLRKVPDDPRYWIWVIISLHNSLQGFMVTALRSGLDLHLMSDQTRKKDRNAWENYERCLQKGNNQGLDELPLTFEELALAPFMKLYEKIKRQDLMEERYTDSRRFVPTAEQDASVGLLHKLRNKYIHFFPHTNFLEVSGLPTMIRDCLEIIRFLVFESGNISCLPELERELKQLIHEVQDSVRA